MSEVAVRVRAQAKLNLDLRVLAREVDGYHQLETLFARIALADDIVVRTGGSRRHLECTGAAAGPTEDNLAWRAAVAFGEWSGWPRGFTIEIEKRIPVGGGLGGGSADAAAVLRALNTMSPAPLAHSELLELAFTLGSDVPYLATDLPLALAWGRGERMLSLSGLEPRGVTLLIPPYGIATRDAFGWLSDEPESGRSTKRAPVIVAPEGLVRWDVLSRRCQNDLEPAVMHRYPELAAVLSKLRAAAGSNITLAGMTGSGSTLFAIGHDARAPDVEAPAGWRLVGTTTPASVVPPEHVM